jgi:predicted dehydrogenase
MKSNRSRVESRRAFLQKAAALAAAGGMPAWYVQEALGQEGGKPETSEAPKPKVGDGVRVGLIGCGGMGTGDARTAKSLGAAVVAVCDVDEKQVAAARKNWPDAEGYSDFRKMVERKELDAVICATPDHWHTLVSMAAMRAGKDVYCEKPLTLTIDEGKRLVRTQNETKRILQTGTQQRSSLYFRMACELVRNERIGKLTKATVYLPAGQRSGPFKPAEVPKGFDWDQWLGQAPLVDYVKERTHLTFRYWWEYSAGTITDWGAHHNDIVLWATGYDRSGPVTVEGKSVKDPIPGGFTVPSEYAIDWTYENGVKHECFTTTADAWNGSIVDPKGQRNGIRFEGTDGWIWVTRGSINASDRELLKYKFGPSDKRVYSSDNHMGNFLECVKSRKEPICPAEVGHRSATMCHLGGIAVRLGRKLKWDPAKEEFVGDAEAQGMVAREMRKPYDYSYVGA